MTRHYSNHETYFNFEIIILIPSDNQELYLEFGEYIYPFEFVLPKNIPTSFEHSIGQTRYTIEGVIDIPWLTTIL